jgi:hypothetical protein
LSAARAAAATAAFALLAACTKPFVPMVFPYGESDRLASATSAFYGGIDRAQQQTYVLEKGLFPAQRLGDAEPCDRVDNTRSTVPSVVLAPPYSAAAVAQRADLAGALAAYVEGVTEVLTSHGHSRSPLFGDLGRATQRLAKSAARHPRGDLFIAAQAQQLHAAVERLGPVRTDPAQARAIAVATGPLVASLAAVLQRDAASAQTVARDANGNLAAMRAATTARALAVALPNGPPAVPCTAPFAARANARLSALPPAVQQAAAAARNAAHPVPNLAATLTTLAAANDALTKYAGSASTADAEVLTTELAAFYASF